MVIVYDYEPSPRNDPITTHVETAVEIAMKKVKPEVAAILNVFPFRQFLFICSASAIENWYTVQYIPAWFPGAQLKRSALTSQRSTAKWVDAPFQHVVKNMVSTHCLRVLRRMLNTYGTPGCWNCRSFHAL